MIATAAMLMNKSIVERRLAMDAETMASIVRTEQVHRGR